MTPDDSRFKKWGTKINRENPPETVDQSDFVTWFRQRFQGIKIAAVPNGGGRHPAEAMALKREGVSAGFPDLIVPRWMLAIEFKRRSGGVISKEQQEWHDDLIDSKWTVIVARGLDDGIQKVEEFLKERTR